MTRALQAMLDFEGRARPRAVAPRVWCRMRWARRWPGLRGAEFYDPTEIGRKVPLGGNVAIPLVKELTARVEGEAAGFVHWGATSQDVIDTGLMLQVREGLTLLRADLVRLGDACAALTRAHRATPMAGRTFLQQGLPTVFGLKMASVAGIRRAAHSAHRRGDRAVRLRCNSAGAVGTLASLGPHGAQVRDELAVELKLHAPAVPWFTTPRTHH